MSDEEQLLQALAWCRERRATIRWEGDRVVVELVDPRMPWLLRRGTGEDLVDAAAVVRVLLERRQGAPFAPSP